MIARVGIYGARAPGLSSSSKVPRLHTHLKERPPEPKALPKEKAKPKKKGEEDYSDEEKVRSSRNDTELTLPALPRDEGLRGLGLGRA